MFKFGLLTAILDGWSFEEAVDTAAEMGFECLEVACWPAGKAERRYAGVSHIDAERVLEDDAYAKYVTDYVAAKGMTISSLAFYPNTMDADEAKRNAAIAHLKALIKASNKLGVGMVTTFIGRDQHKTVDENIELFKEIWPGIIALAEENGVKVAIENCPMLFGADQWPGGQNLFTSPANWEKIFAALPFENLGINYDPSHFIWQMIDYIKPIYEFREKIFHVHIKDIKLYRDRLDRVGVMGYPLEYMSPKLPGLGDVDWGRYISALTDIGYNGPVCVEVEDKAFESSRERIVDSIALSARYMKQFVI